MSTLRGPYNKTETTLEKCVDRLLAKTVETPAGCWEFTGKRDQNGYGVVTWYYRQRCAHRLTYEFFKGAIPEGMIVRHAVCNNPCCVNPDHLLIGTHAENTRDMMTAGRHKTGGGNFGHERSWGKLTVEDVNEMRRLAREGMTQLGIAKRYGVSQSVAGDAICGHTYRDATEPPVPRRGWGPGKKKENVKW